MSRDETRGVVQEIFREILDHDSLVLFDDMKSTDVEGWDSITHIGLVSSIEKHYKIRFSLGELDDLKNVGAMLDAIHRKTGK